MSASAENPIDVFVIGGGINGCGIARDAVGRGYSVCLCEAGDFAGGTSSASTKLIHGGLRYLEHYEFRLVRESLKEREVILQMAPHIVWPLRFVLPHHKGLRPQWLLRLGLLFYDHMGGRKLLPASRRLDLTRDETGRPLKGEFKSAFEYSDCWVQDSRLVVLNAMDAAEKGAQILPRTKVMSAERENGLWDIEIEDTTSGKRSRVIAKFIVNATGPWVDDVLREVFGKNDAKNVRLVRGSHIVIKKKFEHDKCYIFQNSDERIIFAIPYEQNYTLIGTTDAEHGPLDGRPEITPEETGYLCKMASEYFAEPVTTDDVVWTYSGVRPLYDDGASAAQEATRDYVFQKDDAAGAPLINIFGGKITTYRKLAEAMLDEVEGALGKKGPEWTKGSTLPGGDFAATEADQKLIELQKKYPFLEATHADRLFRAYGTHCDKMLEGATNIANLGEHFFGDLYQREVEYLRDNEWAHSAEDILFRRTKLGIAASQKVIAKIERFLSQKVSGPA